jgi:hypothetical protein
MEELIDLIATDSSASSISDKIKDLLYAKAAERVDLSRPEVAASLFGQDESEIEEYPEDEE